MKGINERAKFDVVGQIVVADAAHTQVQTANQILYEQGADYLLTVKENQKGLFATLSSLTLDELDATGFLRLKRVCWVSASRLIGLVCVIR